MNDLNEKSATFNLLRLTSELLEQIRVLRLHVQALEWAFTEGNAEKTRRLAAMRHVLDQDRPAVETERDQQWMAWLIGKQREVERDRAERPN